MEEADAIPGFEDERARLLKLSQEDQVSELLRGSVSLRQQVGRMERLLERVLERLDSLAPLGGNSPVKNVVATPPGAQEGQWVPSTSPEQPHHIEAPGAPKEPKSQQEDDDAELETSSSAGSAERPPGQVVLSDEQFFQLTAMLDRRGPKRNLEGLEPRRTIYIDM